MISLGMLGDGVDSFGNGWDVLGDAVISMGRLWFSVGMAGEWLDLPGGAVNSVGAGWEWMELLGDAVIFLGAGWSCCGFSRSWLWMLGMERICL